MDLLTKADLKEIVRKLRKLPFKVSSAILFGSSTRGTLSRDSDIDILIISDEIPPHRHRRHSEISLIKKLINIDRPLDILLLTREECFSNFRNHNPLFLDIATEGKVLIAENEFLEKLIEETKKYIHNQGIEKTEDGWKFPVPYRKEAFLSQISNRQFAHAMLDDAKNVKGKCQTILKTSQEFYRWWFKEEQK